MWLEVVLFIVCSWLRNFLGEFVFCSWLLELSMLVVLYMLVLNIRMKGCVLRVMLYMFLFMNFFF